MISVNTILYYVFSIIYIIAFSIGIGTTSYFLGRHSPGSYKDSIILRRRMLGILIFTCIVQCIAAIMTITDQSLYQIWAYTWGYWIGHPLIVSSITYAFNLIGEIMTFIMIILLLRFVSNLIKMSSISGENTHSILYNVIDVISIVLSVVYSIVSLGLFILIPYSALPMMPFVLSPDTMNTMNLIGDILTAIGWASLSLIVFCTCILNIICAVKLLVNIMKLKIIDVQITVRKVTLVLILIQIVAFIQIISTIVGAAASFEASLYLVSYILDKTNSLIFVFLCIILYIPIQTLISNIARPITK